MGRVGKGGAFAFIGVNLVDQCWAFVGSKFNLIFLVVFCV
jgi:hypothetical protein